MVPEGTYWLSADAGGHINAPCLLIDEACWNRGVFDGKDELPKMC